MNEFGDRLDRLVTSATHQHRLDDPSEQSQPVSPGRRSGPILAVCIIMLAMVAGSSTWIIRNTDQPSRLTAAHGTSQANPDSGPVPSAWLAVRIGDDSATASRFESIEQDVLAYVAMAQQAENVLNARCMDRAGLAFAQDDVLSDLRLRPGTLALERIPFDANGGYARLSIPGRLRSSPTHVEQLLGDEPIITSMVPEGDPRYVTTLTDCQQRSRTHLFGDLATANDFTELAQTGARLPFHAIALASAHPQVLAAEADWRECMAASGEAVDSRTAAIERSAQERTALGASAPRPGPTERSLAALDRTCNGGTGYSDVLWQGIIAAEGFMATHDAGFLRFTEEWHAATGNVRPVLDEVLGIAGTSRLLPLEAEAEAAVSDDDAMEE